MRLVDEHRQVFGVELICRELRVTPSVYYAAKQREKKPSKRAVRDRELLIEFRRIYEQNHGLYGARKVWWQLQRDGFDVARCSVERLMRQAGLRGVVRGGYKPRTTIHGDEEIRALDLVDRRFSAAGPNRESPSSLLVSIRSIIERNDQSPRCADAPAEVTASRETL